MAENNEKVWKTFLQKHWKMFGVWVTAAILAIIGVILVFLWFVGDAQSTGLVPETLNLWSMGYVLTFLLQLLAREVIYVGIPVVITFIAIYALWWKKLPSDEREEYRRGHLFGKRSHRTDAGSGISFLITIAFAIKIYLDGNWGVAFADWTFDYLVNSWITSLLWVLIIFAIPIGLGALWCYNSNRGDSPSSEIVEMGT